MRRHLLLLCLLLPLLLGFDPSPGYAPMRMPDSDPASPGYNASFVPSNPGTGPNSGPILTHFDSLQTPFDDYLWPTVAGRIVTSTFGEYRRNHFHGGIDISSGDMTGYKVFATRDGYISRVSIAATGYGKMLQIRHTDGYTTLYAHLQKFSPAVELRARAEQLRRETYTIELSCGPGELPVRRGDVIAFSGDTGTGSPHLHFEVRDTRMNPLNPFLARDLRIDDTIPPTIRRVAVSPLHPDALIDGRPEPRVLTARPAGKNAYRIAEPVVITGDAGFAVDVRDRIPGSRFLNGVYRNTLAIDGRIVYEVRLDRTPLREAHEIGIYYDLALLDDGRGRFEKLYMETPNDLPFYWPPALPSGVLSATSLSPGRHEFRITCADYNGNAAQVSGVLVLSRLPGFSMLRSGGSLQLGFFDPAGVKRAFIATRSLSSSWSERVWTPHGAEASAVIPLPPSNAEVVRVIVENRDGVLSPPAIDCLPGLTGPAAPLTLSWEQQEDIILCTVTTSGIFSAPPEITVYEGDAHFAALPVAVDAGSCRAWFRPGSGFRGTRRVVATAMVNGHAVRANAEFDLYPILPGTSGTLSLDGGRLTVSYDSSSVRTTLFLTFTKTTEPDGIVYHLGPERTVLRTGLTVTLKDSLRALHRGLFTGSRGSWDYEGGVNGDPYSGRLPRWLGDLAIFTDDTPPVITAISITGRGSRTPRIRFRYGDDLSGVEYDELKAYIDGHIVIPEVDGEHHRAAYQVPDPLPRGSHQLTILLKDRMGNVARAERQFVLR